MSWENPNNHYRREIEYFFHSIFSEHVLTEDLKSHYSLFNANLNPEHLRVDIQKIIHKKLDVEAIEFFLRLRNRNNILTQKMHALIYLIEVKKDFHQDFYLEKDAFFEGFTSLVFFTLRSVYKLVKGFILVKIYGLV